MNQLPSYFFFLYSGVYSKATQTGLSHDLFPFKIDFCRNNARLKQTAQSARNCSKCEILVTNLRLFLSLVTSDLNFFLPFFYTSRPAHAHFAKRNACYESITPAQTAPLTLECRPPPSAVACFETGVVSHSSLGWETQIRHGRGPGGGRGGPRR